MSQERLAELAGYRLNGEPNRRYVSKLIRDLELLGYVCRLGQRGFNMTNVYRLSVPPDSSSFRLPSNRMLSDEAYVARREACDLREQGFETVEQLFASIEN